MPPVVAALTSVFSAIGFGPAASAWLAGFAVRSVFAIGLSALSRALAPDIERPKPPGITTETTQTGGTDPQAFIVGRYATGGQLVAPPMTHGTAGGTPNAYLTYVIAVSDLPGVTLSRLFVDGDIAAIGTVAHPDYGLPLTLKGKSDAAWVKWYDGTQTTADPMLLAKYAAHPQRPWSADMVATGTAYAILTFRFDRELFKGFPGVRFEVDGIRLYDPRQDPSLGGTGSQSWTNPATWTRSYNPAVMIYNILRGIALPGGDIWGGGWSATDLPTPEWFAAMNACDEPISLAAGGTEPRYRAGFEIAIDREPAEVIEELLKTCAGRMTDIGGKMKVAIGAPGAPVKTLLDGDIIVTDEQSHSLHPSLAQTYNGVHATFPDPASLWESRDAPPRYDAAAEAADGRRLIANVPLPACPYAGQVQRLMKAWINEERRFHRHQLVLPPDAAILEPHDVISWTSARNGYTAKLFEVVEIAHDPASLLQAVGLREVDPSDYDWNASLELPWAAPVPGSDLPPPQSVPSFAVLGTALDDASLTARRPALLLTWNGANQDDVSALEYEFRRLGGPQVVGGVTTNVASGSQIVTAGILPETTYEVRARFVAPRPVTWTPWLVATTPATYISLSDFGDVTQIFTAAGLTVPKLVSALPPAGPERFVGELVFLTTNLKLYRWDGTGWTASVETADLLGTIGADLIASGAVGARAMAIGDFSNLCENPSFERGTGWSLPAGQGWAYDPVQRQTGLRSMRRTWAAGLAADTNIANDLVFNCAPGDRFFISAYVAKTAGAACVSAGVRLEWQGANRAALSSSPVSALDANITVSFGRVSGNVTAPANAVYAVLQPCILGHSAGTVYWDDIFCNRANVGQLLVDGEIITQHIAAGAVNADRLEAGTITSGLIAAAAVKAANMAIDQNLSIDAVGAGFAMGKGSASDFSADGIYMGRTLNQDLSTGFGFLMGSTSPSGLSQHVRATKDNGVDIVNAAFGILAATSMGATTYTTTQTITIAVGTKSLSLELLAGAGGGGVYASAGYTAAQAGQNTVVKLYDGATYTGISWTADGGAAGASTTATGIAAGESSAYGIGGAVGRGAYTSGREDNYRPPTNGGAGTGRGAGGGGAGGGSANQSSGYVGGQGGRKGSLITVSNYNLAALGLANPKLEITIGNGGAGGIETTSNGGNGGAGSGGQVKVTMLSSAILPAGVVTLYPAVTSQFSKAANQSGDTIFPNHGPGLWIVTNGTDGTSLKMNILLKPGAAWLGGWNSNVLTFITDGRPSVYSSDGSAITYNYLFYPMRA